MLAQIADLQVVNGNYGQGIGGLQVLQLQDGTLVLLQDGTQSIVQPESQLAVINSQLLQVPVQVVTNPTSSPELYVLSMTVDEGKEKSPEGIGTLVQKGEEKKKIAISEPQRASTPAFDGDAINDTIISGSIDVVNMPSDDMPASSNDEKVPSTSTDKTKAEEDVTASKVITTETVHISDKENVNGVKNLAERT